MLSAARGLSGSPCMAAASCPIERPRMVARRYNVSIRVAGGGGAVDGVGHQLSGELVLAVGQRDADLAGTAPVQLRRSPGARAASPTQPRVLGCQQTFRFELVEVKLGLMHRHPDRIGGLLAAHRYRLCGHERVKAAAHGIR